MSINDDAGTVTIKDCPVDITAGDTFIVYLQDLPIGYVANSITTIGNKMVLSVEKADKSIFSQIEESDVIQLTPDMYESIPAGGNVSYL